ncbi:MAG: hypothetical protein DDT32_01923 [Syntrophomonadaceae bacterium]|nr:hypothetical protein [Bacillota bacterium]
MAKGNKVGKEITSRALLPQQIEQRLLGPSFELHPTGLTVLGEPTKDEYITAFNRLSIIEGSIHWWYGDLCLSYEGKYGEIKEIAEGSGFQYQTIRDDKFVASRYKLSLRSDNLSFTHHRIAAPREDRLDWLKKAKENNWSTRQLEAEIHKANASRLHMPSGSFAVIYADPPWEYEFSQSESRSIEAHYPTMTTEEICELKNRIPANNDAVLFLWSTNPKIKEALSVIDAWGFEYRTNMAWVKDKIGMGYYCREQHELLLIARKGNIPVPDTNNRPPSIFQAPRLEHSRKPNTVYETIEKMYPRPANTQGHYYIELFARYPRKGWASWGLDLPESSKDG